MKEKVTLMLNVADIRLEVAGLRQQVAVAETKVEQETRGYYVIQNALGDRLQRIEGKIDCLFDKRMCH